MEEESKYYISLPFKRFNGGIQHAVVLIHHQVWKLECRTTGVRRCWLIVVKAVKVTFHYIGYSESGRHINSTYLPGALAKIRVGNNVLTAGFEQGIKDIRSGGKRRVINTPDLGRSLNWKYHPRRTSLGHDVYLMMLSMSVLVAYEYHKGIYKVKKLEKSYTENLLLWHMLESRERQL
ncbi:hypothetical protein MKW98_013753 [Papaver atlanticum]|uniref:peptidylprolyl isomerase n=1 Tax=Papaver atlanticum TaxID=357466 RepID=A0AAD4XAY2_9MAGN|nr:hypothetical protein MKW98_013753 [Papaver atlanticum]